jgi:hypothetical protein
LKSNVPVFRFTGNLNAFELFELFPQDPTCDWFVVDDESFHGVLILERVRRGHIGVPLALRISPLNVLGVRSWRKVREFFTSA